jgi:predicted transcriptional regulator
MLVIASVARYECIHSLEAKMNKTTLEILVKKGLSTRRIATEIGVSQSTVKYWLKKYELKTLSTGKNWAELKTYLCDWCGETNEQNFMKISNGKKSHNRCKLCHNKKTIERGKSNKRVYIEYKGGKCEKCGYSKCFSALEFHHKNPSIKDLRFTGIRYWGIEKAKPELDKCLLLCANCHREKHEGLW